MKLVLILLTICFTIATIVICVILDNRISTIHHRIRMKNRLLNDLLRKKKE